MIRFWQRTAPAQPDGALHDVAVRDLFTLVGEPTPQDPRLTAVARKALRNYLRGATTSARKCSTNVSVLGTVDEFERTGHVHAWGHFIAQPVAHAEVVATTSIDGVASVVMASAWTAPAPLD